MLSSWLGADAHDYVGSAGLDDRYDIKSATVTWSAHSSFEGHRGLSNHQSPEHQDCDGGDVEHHGDADDQWSLFDSNLDTGSECAFFSIPLGHLQELMECHDVHVWTWASSIPARVVLVRSDPVDPEPDRDTLSEYFTY